MCGEGLFRFDDAAADGVGAPRHHPDDLAYELGPASPAWRFLRDLDGGAADHARYEDVVAGAYGPYGAYGADGDLAAQYAAEILRAARDLGWIEDATPGEASWDDFFEAWSGTGYGGDGDPTDPSDSSEEDLGASYPPVYERSAARSIDAGPGHATATRGTGSFEDALAADGVDLRTVGLVSGVHVAPADRADPARFRGTVVGGRIRTHDERFPIDSGGTAIRYLLAVSDGEPVLYLDQGLSRDDADAAGARAIEDYPSLRSHAQIDGEVVCAGDMVVSAGKIVSIDNKSGSYQPSGRNLAAVLHFTRELGILAERMDFYQFISRSEQWDVDAGDLNRLCAAEVWARLHKNR
ncbi:hypothetical protein ACFQ78_34230 [Streptomyces sp. NPDC056519]|uniref:hypothetical protein n=1 Tax=Streptomyces sp. NPDC056519 TaxID=3345849 RepID=UPI00369FEEC0